MAKHYMMLSDLYGRIGQMLREHGDAPIGKVRQPIQFPDESHLPIELVEPTFCTFTHVTTNINNINIKTYELVIEE